MVCIAEVPVSCDVQVYLRVRVDRAGHRRGKVHAGVTAGGLRTDMILLYTSMAEAEPVRVTHLAAHGD